MSILGEVRQRLKKYPDVTFAETPSSIEVMPNHETGFPVSIHIDDGAVSVFFDGWHEHFNSEPEALNCFAFGLSDSCRLRVVYFGDTPTKWTVETQQNGTWVPDSTTGMIFVPFWRPRRVEFLQNQLLISAGANEGIQFESSKNPPQLPIAPKVEGNPHIFWRQVLGLTFWLALLSLLVVDPIRVSLAFALSAVTFADAWVSGLYKCPGKRSFVNISPMSWGIAMTLLFVVTYPTYLLSRNRLRTIEGTNVFFIATMVLGGLMLVILAIDISSAITGSGHDVIS